MVGDSDKIHLIWGYSILVACFEDSLREYVSEKILLPYYGKDWRNGIPEKIFSRVNEDNSSEDVSNWDIKEFLEALHFIELHDIILYKNNNGCIEGFFGDISKERLSEVLIELYEYRNKIAHIKKSSFSELDFISLKDLVISICNGHESLGVKKYVEDECYRDHANEIPKAFFEEYQCLNNLPREDYDLEGGFVGRNEDIRTILKYLNRERPHIITITGSGGVGKTAVALQVAYRLMNSANNPFDAILWFSAKTNKLTEHGIISITPNLEDVESLVPRILKNLDSTSYKKYRDETLNYKFCLEKINNIFKTTKCLLIIDNLETRYSDLELMDFLGEIPEPSMVLITSRKGLGEYEKRVELGALPTKDAVHLFRLICKEKKLYQHSKLDNYIIERLVKNVLQYPLLIKWSIGKVYKGKDVEEAFSKKSYSGESEIAKFVFDDIYLLLSENEKNILFSMIVYGDKPISSQHLLYFTDQGSEELSNSIQQLLLSSLIHRVIETDNGGRVQTKFQMLSLTRAYVEMKLNNQTSVRQSLDSKAIKLERDIEYDERIRSENRRSLVSLGINSENDKIAYQFVKIAKKLLEQDQIEGAKENYEKALTASPDLSYVLIEYSKFLYEYMNKKDLALEISEHATKTDPENYHVWWNLGVLRKKNLDTKKSISAYKKASELNQTDAQLAMELGRVYSFDGQYEMAEENIQHALALNNALAEKGYTYPKQEAIAYSFLSDNYITWSRSYIRREDVIKYSEFIEKAVTSARMALEIEGTDKAVNHIRAIHKEVAVSYATINRIDLAIIHLESALESFVIRGQIHVVDNDFAASLYLDVINAYSTKEIYDVSILKNLVEDANKYIKPGSQFLFEYRSLNQAILNGQVKISNGDVNHNIGVILFYNPAKKYGRIKSDNREYVFFLKNFSIPIKDSEIQDAVDQEKLVAFKTRKNIKPDKPDIAIRIEFV